MLDFMIRDQVAPTHPAMAAFAPPPPASALLEAARLAAVHSYGVLGQDNLGSVDQLAAMVARRFGTDGAAVCFVGGEHLWFAGLAGMVQRELPRGGSPCDAVVTSGETMVVADMAADRRFRAHALSRPPFSMRAYAGAPIEDADGYRIGTVCVVGRRAGALPAGIGPALAELADLTASSLGRARSAAPPPVRIQGWLGVRTAEEDEEARASGLIVVRVAARSPAARAGIRPSDILYAIDGQQLRSRGDLSAAMADRLAGEQVMVRLQRGLRTVECAVAVRPSPATA